MHMQFQTFYTFKIKRKMLGNFASAEVVIGAVKVKR